MPHLLYGAVMVDHCAVVALVVAAEVVERRLAGGTGEGAVAAVEAVLVQLAVLEDKAAEIFGGVGRERVGAVHRQGVAHGDGDVGHRRAMDGAQPLPVRRVDILRGMPLPELHPQGVALRAVGDVGDALVLVPHQRAVGVVAVLLLFAGGGAVTTGNSNVSRASAIILFFFILILDLDYSYTFIVMRVQKYTLFL